MSKPQPAYDTDTDDSQPTPGPTFDSGPWEAEGPPLTGEIVDRASGAVWAADGDLVAETHASPVYGEPSYDRACLIAAAGTAASELPDEYDAVAAVEALPELLAALHEIESSTRHADPWEAGTAHSAAAEALNKARGDTDE